MRQYLSAYVLALLCLISVTASGQHQLSGEVRDTQTQAPLEFANVFLANTTFGTTTDAQGHYTLGNVPTGSYELVVSYLGYQLYRQPLVVDKPLALNILLTPSTEQLKEVVVHPKNKSADYHRFVRLFLGASSFSRQCRIINPQDVIVVYDNKAQELTALAPRSLQVENLALGYRITFHQLDFKANYRQLTVTSVAAPVFEELTPPSSAQQKRWEANRRKAYAGSMPHFLKSLHDNLIAQEGFQVHRLVRLPDTPKNKERITQATDSLAELRTETGFVTLVYKADVPAQQFRRISPDSSHVYLQFGGGLQVAYHGEYPDPEYTAFVTTASPIMSVAALNKTGNTAPIAAKRTAAMERVKLQMSELHLLTKEDEILPTGYLRNPHGVLVEGYWAFEKIGESLPIDYLPTLVK